MQIHWNDKEPIFRQLHDRLRELILEGVFAEGDALPSIREISGEHRINHITVAKALQMLVDENLVEKRRGLGMFVRTGAQETLLQKEKEQFISQEWPAICNRVERLGLSMDELLAQARQKAEKKR